MRISLKLGIIVTVFIAIIVLNGLFSLRILGGLDKELKGVVNRDMTLLQSVTAVTSFQLQKAVVFERIRRIAEELAYQDTTAARQDHLLFHLKLAKDSLATLAKDGAINIVDAKLLMLEGQRREVNMQEKAEIEKVAAVLKEIERAHIHYDALINDVFVGFEAGKYDLPSEVVAQIHRDERKLSTELKHLMERVDLFTKSSLINAAHYERTARFLLWSVILASFLLGLFLSFWVLRAINYPLRGLVAAAHQVGNGDFNVLISFSDQNEFGEVSNAFNKMAAQLQESKKRLEEQSLELRRNLDITSQQKQDLEKVNQELDRFVQTVSHDIRSPLMGVVWYAEFIKSHYAPVLDVKGRESVDGVIRSVDRANALIRDLLTLTRLSRIQNPYAMVSTAALFNDVLENLDYKIKHHEVVININSVLPDIMCDGIKLKEVFLNLLTNAIKFSAHTAKVPKIEVSCLEMPDTHEFIVKDNGIGIAKEHHKDIFKIFKRLDTTGTYEGTGAGLSIVKSVIKDHGGDIWVVSQEGQGSEFHFTIPKRLPS